MKKGGNKMNEFVGKCIECEKDIYCLDGFINGIVEEKGNIICFDCNEDKKNMSTL